MRWLLLLLPTQMGCSLIAAPILDDANKSSPSDGGSVFPDAMPMGDASAGTETDCLDGKDNDGDGKADCADPKCLSAGFACVPSAQSPWVYASMAPMLACGGGTLPSPLSLDPTHNDTCNCTCTPPSCTGAVIETIGSTCSGQMISHPGTGCSGPGITTSAATYFKVVAPDPTDGGCGGGLVDPAIATTSSTACLSMKTGGGCDSGKVCAWTGGAPACVVASGTPSCPSGYSTSHLAIGGASDGRACCTGCSYACSGTLDCYDDNMCTQNKVSFPADGTCGTHGGGSTTQHPYCHWSPTPSCVPGSSSLMGGVNYIGKSTVCCM